MANLRFDPGEEANDPAFVGRLVTSRASKRPAEDGSRPGGPTTDSVRTVCSAESVVDIKVLTFVEVLASVLEAPRRPLVAVLGGAKVSAQLGVVAALLRRVDTLLIGGGYVLYIPGRSPPFDWRFADGE